MTEIKPQFLDELTYAAKYDRQYFRDILTEGIVGADDLEVTEKDTPDMGVTVASGVGYVQGDQAATQGHYRIFNDASKNLTIAASDPTNPRKDRIIAQVYDSIDIGGVDDEWVLEVLTGVAEGVPNAPALPDDALDLAIVDVAANETTILNADITDQRVRFNLQNLFHITKDPIDHPDRSIPSAKMKIEWTVWVPTYSASGSMTYTGVTTFIAKYIVIDKTVFFILGSSGTTGGTASPAIRFTVPIAIADSAVWRLAGGSMVSDGVTIGGFWTIMDANTINVSKYDGSNWGLGADRRILLQGFYRIV